MKFSRCFRLAALLAVLAMPVAGMAADTLHDRIMQQAYGKMQARDFAGAIADFTGLIASGPMDGPAYLGRAYARHSNDELPGAIADYTKALGLARTVDHVPQWDRSLADIFLNLGKAHYDGHEWDEALVNYGHALRCDPSREQVHVAVGHIKRLQGDLIGAQAAFDRVTRPVPEAGIAYQERAVTRQFLEDWKGAIADYRQVIVLAPAHADYAHFFIWGAQVRTGERTAADQELAAYFKARPPAPDKSWAVTISGFLLGTIPEADFLAAATQAADPVAAQGQVCEAWYYSGLKRLFAGERAEAADYFRRCLATKMSYFIEYELAGHELKSLP